MFSKKSILFSISVILSVVIYFIVDLIKEKQIRNYQNTIYKQIQTQINSKFDSIYTKNYFNTTNISKDTFSKLNINEFIKTQSKDFNFFDSKDRYIKVFNKEGIELYSNMPDDYTKEANKVPQYIKPFIKYPTTSTFIHNEHTGISLVNILPVYNGEFIGLFEMRIQFDEMADALQEHKIKTIVLLNSRDSKNININLSHSRQFIKNRYLINKNADKYYMKILEQSTIFKNQAIKNEINHKDGIVIVKKNILRDDNESFAQIYLLISTDDIEFNDIGLINILLNIVMILAILFVGLILYYLSKIDENKRFAMQNEKLLLENEDLKSLSDKLDFNEKKLSNLFNLQPNIMFISNGVSIVQVNKRFMGFFRRYKTFNNFKKQHNNIAELFEPCDMPHYISEPLIDGKDWLEYILENPKRLYKTIMSVDGEPHHFIIKVNEMEYVRNFNERYIVVAFVDVTQDLNGKPSANEDQDMGEEIDITYILENNLGSSIYELTNIYPTKQTIFKATVNEDFGEMDYMKIDLNLLNGKKLLKWSLILPAVSVSYIQNLMCCNYDDEIKEHYDKDLEETSIELADHIVTNLINELNNLEKNDLSNLSFDISETSIIKATDEKNINDVKLYKFIMFIDNKQTDIMIDFDDETLPYIRQIQMLGILFG